MTYWKSFKKGFGHGFYTMFPYYLITLIMILCVVFGQYIHPYEQCKRMYETPEDIMECVWIKENP